MTRCFQCNHEYPADRRCPTCDSGPLRWLLIIFLAGVVTVVARGQTPVTTPLQVLAPNNNSAPSVVQVEDSKPARK